MQLLHQRCAAVPRQGTQAAAGQRPPLPPPLRTTARRRRSWLPPPRTLPDGPATSEALPQLEAVAGVPAQPQHSQQQLDGLNNAVERRRSPARGGAAKRAPLPPAVEWLLSSPTLERPDGTGG